MAQGRSVPIQVGGKRHLLLVFEDITDYKTMQDNIAKSRDFYLTLLKTFRHSFSGRLDKKCNYFNNCWLNFTGRKLEEELGHEAAFTLRIEEKSIKIYTSQFDLQKPFEMEYRLKASDGQYHWVVNMGKPFYGMDGRFAGYVVPCMILASASTQSSSCRKPRRRLRLPTGRKVNFWPI